MPYNFNVWDRDKNNKGTLIIQSQRSKIYINM